MVYDASNVDNKVVYAMTRLEGLYQLLIFVKMNQFVRDRAKEG